MEIARAMCTEPELLCLDEPAAGLNPRESAELNNLLTAIPKETGTSILLIEHDMSVVMEISDHVVVLEYGTKISDGDPEHVKSDPKVIAAYLGVDDDDDDDQSDDGPETIVEGFDGEPDAAHAPRSSASMMAGPIDQTTGHSAGGETIKVSSGASRANRVTARLAKAFAAKASDTASAKPVAMSKAASKPAVRKANPASAAPAAVMSVPAKPAAAEASGVKAKAGSMPVAAKATAKPAAKTVAKPAVKAIAKPAAKAAAKPVVKAAAKPAAKASAKPAATKAATAKPTATKPAPTKPVTAKPAAPKAKAASPSAGKAVPVVRKPSASKPSATKPSAAKMPAAAKPAVAPKTQSKAQAKAQAKPTGKPAPTAAAPAKPDDLKLIKGIGPVNDAKLRAHGVTRFAQIAAWKKADVVEAERYLEFDGRIAREDWVAQAKSLAKGGKPLRGGEK